jgi:DNA polymerase-1
MANLELPKDKRLSEEEAKEYIERYFTKFSGIRRFQIMYPREVKRTGYATTMLGRKRYLPAINFARTSKEGWRLASAAERAAVSTIIQGTASDVLKLAMLKADKAGLELAVQIHDQLLVYSKIENAEKEMAILKDCMENCGLTFEVPIKAKIALVDHWEQESDGAIELEGTDELGGGSEPAEDEEKT